MQAAGIHCASFASQNEILSFAESRCVPIPPFFVVTAEEFGLFWFADENVWVLRQDCGEGCSSGFSGSNDDEVG